MTVATDAVHISDLSLDPPKSVGQFSHPYPHEFSSADMFGDIIVAFDYKGGIYHLKADNL